MRKGTWSVPKKHLPNQKSDNKELLLGLGPPSGWSADHGYEQTFRSWHQPNCTDD